MTKTDIADVRNLKDEDLSDQIKGIRKELFDLRFQKATSQLTNTHQFKKARVKLAQLLTIQKERVRSQTLS